MAKQVKQSELSIDGLKAKLFRKTNTQWYYLINTEGVAEASIHSDAVDYMMSIFKETVISEGRKMAEYAINRDDKDFGYPLPMSMLETRNHLRKEQRTRLDKYIKENYGE